MMLRNWLSMDLIQKKLILDVLHRLPRHLLAAVTFSRLFTQQSPILYENVPICDNTGRSVVRNCENVRHYSLFYEQHFYKQRHLHKIKQMLSNTLSLNFCYLKIIRILHPRYHPKIIGDIL